MIYKKIDNDKTANSSNEEKLDEIDGKSTKTETNSTLSVASNVSAVVESSKNEA